MELLYCLLYVVIAAVSLLYLYLRQRFSYWAQRGVVHEKPVLLFGNMRGFGRTRAFRQPFHEFYMKYKHSAPFGGFYLFMRRAVVLFDLELVKRVLIKDFANFSTRGNYYNERDDPLTAHLFNLDGEKWRRMRAQLSATFTSGKMKFMFPMVVEVAERFVLVLRQLLDRERLAASGSAQEQHEVTLEIMDLLARFTTDVIGSCAFGLECNSLKDPQTEFRLMGKKVFTELRHKRVVIGLMQAFPQLSRKLGMKMLPDDVSEFFMRVVKDTVQYREREHIQRNDFMNLLIELKQNNETESLTLEQIAAQAFAFFLAGFETSSSSLGFAFYELALNQDIQKKARTQINEVLERHDGQLTYEAMHEMKYLYQILQETMRKYSIASLLLRKTLSDYAVPGTDFVIEKGVSIIVPVDAIHRDPEIYPDPETFDPERFSAAEIQKRHSMSWLAFGDGPRNCLAQRFGEMQAMIGLIMLLKHFRFSIAKTTTVPIEIDVKAFLLASKGGITLQVETL